jgi:hypothetical protein
LADDCDRIIDTPEGRRRLIREARDDWKAFAGELRTLAQEAMARPDGDAWLLTIVSAARREQRRYLRGRFGYDVTRGRFRRTAWWYHPAGSGASLLEVGQFVIACSYWHYLDSAFQAGRLAPLQHPYTFGAVLRGENSRRPTIDAILGKLALLPYRIAAGMTTPGLHPAQQAMATLWIAGLVSPHIRLGARNPRLVAALTQDGAKAGERLLDELPGAIVATWPDANRDDMLHTRVNRFLAEDEPIISHIVRLANGQLRRAEERVAAARDAGAIGEVEAMQAIDHLWERHALGALHGAHFEEQAILPTADPAEALAAREEFDALLAEARLTENEMRVLALAEDDVRTAAAQLGRAANTIKVLRFRARKKLRATQVRLAQSTE